MPPPDAGDLASDAPEPPRVRAHATEGGPDASRRRRVDGTDGRRRGQRHRVRLLGQARRAHATTPPARRAATGPRTRGRTYTTSSPARPATVRATRATLCSPRALRHAGAELGASSASASGRPAAARSASAPPPGPGGGDPGGDGRRRLARRPGEELVGVRPAQRDDEVEAVQQRRRDAAPVAGPGDGGAGAGALVDPSPQGHGFMAATRRNAAGKVTVPPARLTRIDPLLERLAQRLEGGDGELAELVEEEDAVGGQAHLARPERPAAATDQRDDGGLVVRRAERRAARAATPSGSGAAGGRVDAGHRERLVGA